MNFPQIRLQSSPASISIQTTPGRMEIQQPPAELYIQQPKAILDIETITGKLTIDQTEAWADMNIKSVFRMAEENAQEGKQAALEATGSAAQDGDELMRIENGGGTIASQAQRNGESPQYEFNIGWIPRHGSVKIQYAPATVNINARPQEVINNTRIQKPIIEHVSSQVDVSLKQHGTLDIDFEGLKFVGINYEQEI
ncbi:hypothetical protein FZC84_12880 [Rossellomorea vietnamensis]|uniref:Uncharacterized protein n=1 Tax=Rossellomorea vietnamensis TaxID=218284 RepID=A0A5D4MB30_9BACI|nr:DUF6470 family protein [Rossellomorea vietnamensis]TYR98912.1 hypothetical protein FZC84_12880 [Rossellomorea vietnamensis]